MRDTAQAASILSLVARGSHRLSEIAGRLEKPATSLVRPMQRLLELGLVGREVPFVLPLPAGGAPRVFLEGRIDLLARRGDALIVRDYKYTRPTAEAVVQHGAQLAAYRLAVAGAGEPAAGELVFLRGGTRVVPLPAIERGIEESAAVEAAVALGAAHARGDVDAFPRRPPGPSACEALGCGYVRWCWGTTATDTAPDRPTCSGAA